MTLNKNKLGPLPLEQAEPVVGHVVALPGVHGEAGGEWRAVGPVRGGVEVGAVPGDAARGGRRVLDHGGVEGQVHVLVTHTGNAVTSLCVCSTEFDTNLCP